MLEEKHALRHVSPKDYITHYTPYDKNLNSSINDGAGKSAE
jgi:hypothetical protein